MVRTEIVHHGIRFTIDDCAICGSHRGVIPARAVRCACGWTPWPEELAVDRGICPTCYSTFLSLWSAHLGLRAAEGVLDG